MRILEIIDLEKNYEFFNLKLSLSLAEKEIIGFVGPNGAGKTTTLNIILNTVKKDSGEVLLFSKDHIKHESAIKQRMGVVLDEHNFFPELKIDYILKFCASLYPKWDWSLATYLREKMELTANKRFKALSKGMKVKLALIVALASRSDLLLFDELTSSLDPKARHFILEIIENEIRERRPAMLFSSHNMLDVERLADRIVLLNKGRIVLDESKQILLSKWKKISFTGPDQQEYWDIKNVVSVKRTGEREFKLITSEFAEPQLDLLRDMGVEKVKVNDLSLEEIFLEKVGE